jgi:hypothetical protein
MFGWLRRRAYTPRIQPSLDSLQFDTAGYEPQGEPKPGRVRLWYTPEGDGVSLNYFPIPPDFPAGAGSVGQLRDFYAARLAGSGGRLVELDVLRRPAASLRVIVKVPQQPSGLTYTSGR